MKIKSDKTNVEVDGTHGEWNYGATDLGFMFEILRSKLYSDPIKAIAREISCNARDAHREAKIPKTPIEIDLPSTLSSNHIRIRDFGPGISPDRMSNVFLKYGASTKRDSNQQTGGFGLGAKTPFAYTDTFSITTCVDRVERTYTAYIDESRVGKIALLSEKKTKKRNGTEIVIPVQKEHFAQFEKEFITATYWWDVRPKFTNSQIDLNLLLTSVDYLLNDSVMPVRNASIDKANFHAIKLEKDVEVYCDFLHRVERSYGGLTSPCYDSLSRTPVLILIDRMPYPIDGDNNKIREIYNGYRDNLMRQMFSSRDYWTKGRNQFNYNYLYADGFRRFPVQLMTPPILILPFKNGELKVSVNREKIQFSDQDFLKINELITKGVDIYNKEMNSEKMYNYIKQFRY